MAKSLPYENATSGKTALLEMQKIVAAFGATSFGCMEDFAKGEVIIQFEHHGRRVTLAASAKGYAAAWLRMHPWKSARQVRREDYERRALKQGSVAVYSILRDWIKGQVTAVECGILEFESAFLGQIMLPSGRTVYDTISHQGLLAPPKERK